MGELAFGVVPRAVLTATDGLTFLQAMIDGAHPAPPIARTLGFTLVRVAEGLAVFEGVPGEAHLNPIGTVHAGFAATLLDSCVACAVHTTLKQGEGYTTLELKLNLVRPILPATGTVTAEGRIIHRGRTVATAEGRLADRAGRLLAHATTTCQIFPAGATP
jgi:uncharacterized protein (TIGR00369 family)